MTNLQKNIHYPSTRERFSLNNRRFIKHGSQKYRLKTVSNVLMPDWKLVKWMIGKSITSDKTGSTLLKSIVQYIADGHANYLKPMQSIANILYRSEDNIRPRKLISNVLSTLSFPLPQK